VSRRHRAEDDTKQKVNKGTERGARAATLNWSNSSNGKAAGQFSRTVRDGPHFKEGICEDSVEGEAEGRRPSNSLSPGRDKLDQEGAIQE